MAPNSCFQMIDCISERGNFPFLCSQLLSSRTINLRSFYLTLSFLFNAQIAHVPHAPTLTNLLVEENRSNRGSWINEDHSGNGAGNSCQYARNLLERAEMLAKTNECHLLSIYTYLWLKSATRSWYQAWILLSIAKEKFKNLPGLTPFLTIGFPAGPPASSPNFIPHLFPSSSKYTQLLTFLWPDISHFPHNHNIAHTVSFV